MAMSVTDNVVSLVWNDLSFEVKKRVWTVKHGLPFLRSIRKEILKPQNGEIYSGSLTALMGPSGAGKSTLLNCVTGRQVTGVKGRVVITCRGAKPKAAISFVPQKDDLFDTFTVHETLLFASKMKNRSKDTVHEDEAARVMEDLNLYACRDVKISRCSGGQVKRVCIGVELVSNPDVLVLDEPTTGLDSSTAFQCISLLKRLIESKCNPPAIVATIHQPNHKIFQEFNLIYLLSRHGQNLYYGPPMKMIDFFDQHNLKCPKYCNPADYAIEVAYGDYGEQVFGAMAKDSHNVKFSGEDRGKKYDLHKVVFRLRTKKMPLVRHTMLLMKRSWQHTLRDSNQFWFKNILSALVALLLSFLWVEKVGTDDGCWASYNPVNQSQMEATFIKSNLTADKNEFIGKISHMMDNSALLFSVNTFALMMSMAMSALSFPLETNRVLREFHNDWHRPSSYFWAKILADIPPMVLYNLIFWAIIYPLTGQRPEVWRFFVMLLVVSLFTDVSQTLGSCIGITLSNDIVSAVLIASSVAVPLVAFAGFLVRYSSVPWYLKPLSYLCYMRYSFEGLLVAIYGFSRCSSATGQSFIEKFANAQNPFKVVYEMWKASNVTQKDMNKYSRLLKVQEQCLSSVVNNSMRFMQWRERRPSRPSPSSNVSVQIVTEDNSNPSYIMQYYELEDNTLWFNIASLIVCCILVKLCLYLLLRYKTRPTL